MLFPNLWHSQLFNSQFNLWSRLITKINKIYFFLPFQKDPLPSVVMKMEAHRKRSNTAAVRSSIESESESECAQINRISLSRCLTIFIPSNAYSHLLACLNILHANCKYKLDGCLTDTHNGGKTHLDWVCVRCKEGLEFRALKNIK